MERARTTWDGEAVALKPKGAEPPRNVWGTEVNAPLTKKDEGSDPEKTFTREELDRFDEEFERLNAIYMNDGETEFARDRANRRAQQLIIEKQGGNRLVHGSAEIQDYHQGRTASQSEDSGRSGAFTQFNVAGFNAKKKNRYELFHKEGE